jgi:ppGpp synthetase/RelA/SpoT-type nucleotidyltranferase
MNLSDYYDANAEAYDRVAEDVARELSRALGDVGKRSGLTAPRVTWRRKGKARFLRKARRRDANAYDVEEAVRDVAGVRVVCKNTGDIAKVEELVRRVPGLEVVAREDQVESPTIQGYRATKLIVRKAVTVEAQEKTLPCEVQIRTLLQDAWAEFTHGELYENELAPSNLRRNAARIADLLAVADAILQDIRDDLESPTAMQPLLAGLYRFATGGAELTVGESWRAAETFALTPREAYDDGDSLIQAWGSACDAANTLFAECLLDEPTPVEALTYGLPLALGADRDGIVSLLAERHDLAECDECGRLVARESLALHDDIGGQICDRCAGDLPVCYSCGRRTDSEGQGYAPNDGATYCRSCESSIYK